uniref:Cyclin N-terminal domain-containing protein 2 n=1 Tax=Denticeps clupeoides TaxID=299321 RepID=A0AAY4EC12_9TELE
MAQTGFCDSKALLDLHKKERRVPLRTWANSCLPKERCPPAESMERWEMVPKAEQDSKWVRVPLSAEEGIILDYAQMNTTHADGPKEEAMLRCLHGLQDLRILVPSLLRHEMELAMDKLGLIYDRTYAWDIFSDMMRSQLRDTFPSADLPNPFTENTRAILVDWLIQVHEVFHFSEESLYLAVHLLNRCLRQIKVSVASLQLLGVVCLFVAGKKEECLLPEVSELCYLMENAYTKHQLLRMERRVLCGLKFNLSHCPPLHFLLLSASIARCSNKMVWMARYLLELSLLEGQCVMFLPVQLAGAALRLARLVLQEPSTPESEAAWCISSTIHVGSEATLLKIMQILAVAAARARTRETRATYIKFSTADTMCVSHHPALKGAPCLLGLTSMQT